MLNLIGFGIVMGLAFALPPGIVTAETFRRGLARGFPAALSVQLGSLIGDATYCVLALAGVTALVQNPIAQRGLGIAGAIFLIYLAAAGIRAELKELHPPVSSLSKGEIERANSRGAFVTGMLLSLTNPFAIGFWLAMGGAIASFGALESGGATALFFASFFGACCLYAFVMALLIGWTRRAIPAQMGRALAILCSGVIGVLGVALMVQVVSMVVAG